jgi:excisionase family DNA binding protein
LRHSNEGQRQWGSCSRAQDASLSLDAAFEPLLDSEEAAAPLKIHPKTLQKMARNGEISAIHIGKLWRFRVSALNEWLERNCQLTNVPMLRRIYIESPADLRYDGSRQSVPFKHGGF